MGKAKKRSFHKGINECKGVLTREGAVENVVQILKDAKSDEMIEAYKLITLFGMSAEEILEAGATYEAVLGLKGILKEE